MGGYLAGLVAQGDEAIRQLGGVPPPHPAPQPYEPDSEEIDLCRKTLDYVRQHFGDEFLQEAVRLAGIESGVATDDDFDFYLYSDVLEHVQRTHGKEAHDKILAYLTQP